MATTPIRDILEVSSFYELSRNDNFSAVVPPTVNDDETLEYVPGSRWHDTVTEIQYTCFDNTAGAALWVRTSSASQGVNNYTAIVDPTITDDETLGYIPGSKWYNTVSQEVFTCVDGSTGAAIWLLGSLTVDDLGTAALADVGTAAGELPTNADTDAKYKALSVPISEVAGTSYTLTASDNSKLIWTTNASPVTLTLPEDLTEALSDGFNVMVVQGGSGQVSFAVEGSDVLNSVGANTSIDSQYRSAMVSKKESGVWYLDTVNPSFINVGDLGNVDTTGIGFNGQLLQYQEGSSSFEIWTATDGNVKINDVLDGVSGIGLTPVVVVPGDEYNLTFSSVTHVPHTVNDVYPLAGHAGRTLIDTFTEGVELTAPGPNTVDLTDDLGDGVDPQKVEVTRQVGGAGPELGLIEDTDFSISYDTGGGGADELTVNSVGASDVIRVYASHAQWIFRPSFKTWVENNNNLQWNLFRVLIAYTKSGTQSGNTLVIRFFNPSPASSFSEIVTFDMPGGATFQSNSVQFIFATIGDNLSLPNGTITTAFEPQYVVGTSITLDVAKNLEKNLGDPVADENYPVRVYRNTSTLTTEGVDYTLTYNDYDVPDQITILSAGQFVATDTVDIEVDGTGQGYRMTVEVLGGNTMDIDSMSMTRLNGFRT